MRNLKVKKKKTKTNNYCVLGFYKENTYTNVKMEQRQSNVGFCIQGTLTFSRIIKIENCLI